MHEKDLHSFCSLMVAQVMHRKDLQNHESPMPAQVDFETELNIAPYMSNRRAAPQMYELYGVLVHAGHSVHSGHYYCFVRGPNGIWHHMDDTRVSQVRCHACCLNGHGHLFGKACLWS